MANQFRQIRGALLQMDLHEFAKLYIFFQQFPIQARKATAQLLNDLGFAWRPLAVTTLASRLIMRNPRFILSKMRVEKTSAKPIPQQAVIVGSTYTKGKTGEITFDGFRSLQGLSTEPRNRTLALAARGGSKQAQAKKSGKLSPDSEIPKPEDWDDIQLPQSRVQAMIRALAESSVYGKRMIIPKGHGFSPGLYGVKNKRGYYLPSGRTAPKLFVIQHFNKRPHHARWAWIQESIKRLIRYAPMAKMWEHAIQKVMPKPGA
jgi:hypothetical protein